MTIEIQDGAKTRRYTLKEPASLTIADYRALQGIEAGPDMRESLIDALKRLTGIPKTHIRRMPPGELSKALDIIGETMVEVAKAKEVAEGPPPTSFEHEGTTYCIPQDIERDTQYGQWEDLHKVLIPQAQTDADIHKAIIACMCLPEGQEYSGAVVTESMGKFESLPISLSLGIAAFFFASSNEFLTATNRSILQWGISKLPNSGPEPTSSESVTAPTLASGEPPPSSLY